jgi:regulator of protease activity HflC (stomatin/prohibitin superfamily)
MAIGRSRQVTGAIPGAIPRAIPESLPENPAPSLDTGATISSHGFKPKGNGFMESIIAAVVLAILGYFAGGVKVINEGEQGVVEEFGKFKGQLAPGPHWVPPLIQRVSVESTREQFLDIEPKPAITQDNVPLEVDGVEDLEGALENLVSTTLRDEIGQLTLEKINSNRGDINKKLLKLLDDATAHWGVKVIRVEIQGINFSEDIRKSLELERSAQSKRSASIAEAEGKVKSIKLLSEALENQPNAATILKYLALQDYVSANSKIGESENAKVIFMDPKALSETIGELIAGDDNDGGMGNGRNVN